MGNWKWRIWRCRAAISSCSEGCGRHGRAGASCLQSSAVSGGSYAPRRPSIPLVTDPRWAYSPAPPTAPRSPSRAWLWGLGGDRRVGDKVAACAHLVRQTAGLTPRASGSRGGRVGPRGPLPVGGPLCPALGEDPGVCGPAPRSQRDETQPQT